MSQAAADVGDRSAGREVVSGHDARDLEACLGGHRHVEQLAEAGIALEEGEEPVQVHLVRGWASRLKGVVEVAQVLRGGRGSVYSDEVAHGVRMVSAEQLRRGSMAEAVLAVREDAVGGEKTEHATQCLGIRAGGRGEFGGRLRRVAERICDPEVGHGGQAVPDHETSERLGQRVEGRLRCRQVFHSSPS